MPKVRFVFSKALPNGVQVHDQVYDFDAAGERLTYNTLREAEVKFGEWFEDNFQGCFLIQWKALSADGSDGAGPYATYRAYLPVGKHG